MDEEKYTGDKKIEKSLKVEKSELKKIKNDVKIMFLEDRKFDLHIGRDMITFLGREEKTIPAAWIEHKDWKNVKNKFVEVK